MNFEAGQNRIEDLIQKKLLEIGDGYRAKNTELSTSGLPFARAGNINDGFRFDDADFFPEADLPKVGNKVSMAGDVVFTSKGTVGRFAMVRASTPRFVYSPQLCFWRSLDQNVLVPEFLYYWMNSAEFLQQIGYLKGQTDMADYVSLRDQRKITATIPTTSVQREVVAMMAPLDARIDLLRETNATLEAIAQALFKSWFVDFDPVRAKQEGRMPEGMDEATAALFPDCFMKSVLGQVPSGWSVETIKNRTSNLQYGFTQSATTKPIGPHFLRITDIRDSKVDWQSVPFCAASDAEAKKYRVEDGDIFIARTGASTGENIYIVDPPAAVFASYLIRLQFSSLGIGRIVGEFVRTSAYKNYVSGTIGGSAQPNANAQTLAAASMVFPPEEIASAFYERIRPLDLKKAANSGMAETLANLRDTLLPRLISGQLRLPGAVDESVELLTRT